jgi:hypothetical protein
VVEIIKRSNPMAFEKVGYWMAVGVLALIVSNTFVIRHGNDVRDLASRSLVAVEQVPAHVTRFMAVAEMMIGGGGARFAQTQTKRACAQSRLASLQSILASREAGFARLQAEHARWAAMQELRGPLLCPRQNLRIVLPELPAMRTGGTF